MSISKFIAFLILTGFFLFTTLTFGAEEGHPMLRLEDGKRGAKLGITPASDEPQLALKRFKIPEGFQSSVFAAEPLLANPVAFCFDEQGRVFVAETYRLGLGVQDIRNYMTMLDDDLACRTVEDRLALTKKWFGDEFKQFSGISEIVRLVEDRDHDGKADFSSVYADGFDSALDGIASGVLAHRGKLWLANIPAITELQGIDSKGRAKSRQTLSYGYGVRFSYIGHDLHGLILGPDGKLYFSFGDRGANVKTKEGKTLAVPDEGAIFRCNQDGTELEMVHHGLRNPQELAFDEFGNLFTGDNDFDHGDHERLVYVVEGGDSGWRVGYQHPPMGYDLVPWMADQLWIPHFEGQAAYIIPPITNLDDGPSGLVFYPGTGLPAKYDGHFFLCHFKGNIAKSGIRTFTVQPSGAGFSMEDSEQFIWNVEATDVDFGPDSRLYFSDWGEGWATSGKGRIFTAVETNSIKEPIVAETEKLIAQGFAKSSQKELLKYLAHPNMKVRLEAQYTLAEQGKKSVSALAKLAANKSAKSVARRHAIWALGQIGRKEQKALVPLLPLLADADSEIRAQSAKILGDDHANDAYPGLVKLLTDSSLRVRYFAAQSLGKLQRNDAVQPIVAMLRENNDRDLYLRHVGVVALKNCAQPTQLRTLIDDKSAAVRMAALLAMRRMPLPEIAAFLNDDDELIVAEAARAINDMPINDAFPQLAVALSSERKFNPKHEKQFQAFQLRAVNANFRLGKTENADALAAFSAKANSPEATAAEALTALASWSEPIRRDRVVGVSRPLPGKRNIEVAASALRPVINKILTGNQNESVKLAAINAITQLRLSNTAESLHHLVADAKAPTRLRLEALKALEQLKDPKLSDAAQIAQSAEDELLRKEGNRLTNALHPEDAIAQIRATLKKGSIAEKQGALTTLAGNREPEAESLLSKLVDQYIAGTLPREIDLELVEAAGKSSPALTEKLKNASEKINPAPSSPPLLPNFRLTLYGGNAESGKKIFFERAEASCLRCHKINGEGGDVGPNLTGIGSRQTREYLLQSMIQPNAQIAPGFETVLVVLKSGASFAGVFKSEDEKELVINSPEDGLVKIAKADIKTRDGGKSGMIEGLGDILSKRDLRDLVEFLATSK